MPAWERHATCDRRVAEKMADSETPEAGRASVRQHRREELKVFASSHIAYVHWTNGPRVERGASGSEAALLAYNPTYCVQHIRPLLL